MIKYMQLILGRTLCTYGNVTDNLVEFINILILNVTNVGCDNFGALLSKLGDSVPPLSCLLCQYRD